MSIGLSDNSDIKEKTIIEDDKVVKYTISETRYDINKLNQEKQSLIEQLSDVEPSIDELIELGKSMHPYYSVDRDYLNNRISEINKIIGE